MQLYESVEKREGWLDFLRFLAATIVIIAHMYDSGQALQAFDLKTSMPILHTGVAGVIIFFLISGYLMPKTISRCTSLKEFFLRRAIRIYPLLLCAILYSHIRFHDFSISKITALILPFADFFYAELIVHAVDWTLRIEFFYYILLSLMYFKGIFSFKSNIICIGLTSILVASTYFYNEQYFNYRLIYLNFIFVGSQFYLIQKDGFLNSTKNKLTACLLVWSIAIFSFCRVQSAYLLPGLLFGTLIFFLAYLVGRLFPNLNSMKTLTFLGSLSYPSYLLHMLVFVDIFQLTKSHFLTFISFLSICYLSNILIEKPSIKKFKSMLKPI